MKIRCTIEMGKGNETSLFSSDKGVEFSEGTLVDRVLMTELMEPECQIPSSKTVLVGH